MARSYPFAQVDVFSTTAYLGNPVAVILDAEGIDDTAMQRIARWTNLSETTFVLPATTPGADYRLRIFTPGGELPFAGHPTLGSAHAWLEHGGTPLHTDRIVQQCQVGLVDVRRDQETLSFTAPPTQRSGPLGEPYLAEVVTAFGLYRDQVVDHQWVDNGPGWSVIQLTDAAAVLALEPDLSRIPTAMIGAIGFYPDGAAHTYEMRSFAPRIGIGEDPVCGSMNASVGQWLTRTGAVPDTYQVSQGTRLGRNGTITITVDDGNVWVGGNTLTCFNGNARI